MTGPNWARNLLILFNLSDAMPLSKKLFISLPFIPMMMHWIMPAGLEGSMYVQIGEVRFFLFNICFFIYIFLYKSYIKSYPYSQNLKNKILLITSISLLYIFVHTAITHFEIIDMVIFNGISYIFYTFLFIIFPISYKQISEIKWLFAAILTILTLEVVIYSLGIAHYSGINDSGIEYGGILRISTTAGAATGTGLILMMLGMCNASLFNFNKVVRISLIVIATIGIFFTISRGSILTWSIFLLYLLYKKVLLHTSISKKIALLLGIAIIVGAMFQLGVFNPLIERDAAKSTQNDATSGRDDRFGWTLAIADESGGMGVGIAMVYTDKSIMDIVPQTYRMAPHNTYLTVFAEQGYLGLGIFLIYLFTIVLSLNYRNPLSIGILIILLINFNTEAILLTSEFYGMLFFLISMALKRKDYAKSAIYHI